MSRKFKYIRPMHLALTELDQKGVIGKLTLTDPKGGADAISLEITNENLATLLANGRDNLKFELHISGTVPDVFGTTSSEGERLIITDADGKSDAEADVPSSQYTPGPAIVDTPTQLVTGAMAEEIDDEDEPGAAPAADSGYGMTDFVPANQLTIEAPASMLPGSQATLNLVPTGAGAPDGSTPALEHDTALVLSDSGAGGTFVHSDLRRKDIVIPRGTSTPVPVIYHAPATAPADGVVTITAHSLDANLSIVAANIAVQAPATDTDTTTTALLAQETDSGDVVIPADTVDTGADGQTVSVPTGDATPATQTVDTTTVDTGKDGQTVAVPAAADVKDAITATVDTALSDTLAETPDQAAAVDTAKSTIVDDTVAKVADTATPSTDAVAATPSALTNGDPTKAPETASVTAEAAAPTTQVVETGSAQVTAQDAAPAAPATSADNASGVDTAAASTPASAEPAVVDGTASPTQSAATATGDNVATPASKATDVSTISAPTGIAGPTVTAPTAAAPAAPDATKTN